jgi:hypothetical protein
VITSATKIGEITEWAECRPNDGTTNDVSFRTDYDVVIVDQCQECQSLHCKSLDSIILLMNDIGGWTRLGLVDDGHGEDDEDALIQKLRTVSEGQMCGGGKRTEPLGPFKQNLNVSL